MRDQRRAVRHQGSHTVARLKTERQDIGGKPAGVRGRGRTMTSADSMDVTAGSFGPFFNRIFNRSESCNGALSNGPALRHTVPSYLFAGPEGELAPNSAITTFLAAGVVRASGFLSSLIISCSVPNERSKFQFAFGTLRPVAWA